MSLLSVSAGLCRVGGLGDCAFSASHCQPGVNFESSRQLQAMAWSHGGICLDSLTVDELTVGRCGNQAGSLCTGHEDACPVGQTFERFVEGCSVKSIEDSNTQGSVFGRCGDDFCAWSQDSCLDGESWHNADQAQCECGDVKVGACVYDGIYYCAVAKDSCDSDSTFLNARELRTTAGAPDCRLCRAERGAGGVTPTNGPNGMMSSGGNNNDDSGLSSGQVAGAVIGGLVGLALIVGLFVFGRRRVLNKAGNPNAKNHNAPPIKQVEPMVVDGGSSATTTGKEEDSNMEEVVSEMGDVDVDNNV